MDLADNHSQDTTTMFSLLDVLEDHDYPNQVRLTQAWDTDPAALDFLIVTQRIYDEFANTGPEAIEEVVQEDLKVILNPGEYDRVLDKTLQEIGR